MAAAGHAYGMAPVCDRYNISTADATLIVQQAAKTSKLSSREVLISRPVKNTNYATNP